MPDQQLIEAAENTEAQKGMAFTFGDPESVINGRELWGYIELWQNGKYYEPPLPMAKLAKTFNMSVHHRSAIAIKINLIVKHFVPSRWLTRQEFELWILNFLQMGNAFMERIPNLAGRIMQMKNSPAAHTRVGVKPGTYYFVNTALGLHQDHEFAEGSIFHLAQPDVAQEIYGLPEWLSALQSGLLNENATLFRRRYYLNGAHVGFLMYINDPLADKETVEAIKEAMSRARGIGNFRNMLVYNPGGKKDGIQMMPIAEATTKDEFSNIKNITRDDMLAAHRVPPQLIGIIPQNNGGFGDVGKATDVFFANEIEALMQRTLMLNDWAGAEIINYKPYVQQAVAAPAPK